MIAPTRKNRMGTRNSPTNEHLIRSTGVLGTASAEMVRTLIDKVYQGKNLEMALGNGKGHRARGAVDCYLV